MPKKLAAVLAEAAGYRFVLDENPGCPALPVLLPQRRAAPDRVSLLVGPEGGWTEEERAGFDPAGWTPASMGPLILRAETAAIAALAVIHSAWLLN